MSFDFLASHSSLLSSSQQNEEEASSLLPSLHFFDPHAPQGINMVGMLIVPKEREERVMGVRKEDVELDFLLSFPRRDLSSRLSSRQQRLSEREKKSETRRGSYEAWQSEALTM